jgi:hypothetical protein
LRSGAEGGVGAGGRTVKIDVFLNDALLLLPQFLLMLLDKFFAQIDVRKIFQSLTHFSMFMDGTSLAMLVHASHNPQSSELEHHGE